MPNELPAQPEPPVPPHLRAPHGARVPPLRPEDARENPSIRGRVVRAGAQVMAALWED